MARSSASTTRKVVGLGFLPEEARHGFLIDVPKGTSSSDMICITEHRGNDLDSLGARATQPPQPNAPGLRVVIDRARWLGQSSLTHPPQLAYLSMCRVAKHHGTPRPQSYQMRLCQPPFP